MSRLSWKWASVLLLALSCGCGLKDVKYAVTGIEGGGYLLQVNLQKRHLKVLTAEGMFPVETGSYRITVLGEGHDWSFKGRNGYYYSPSEVKSDRRAWDYCYAWVDSRREFLYLNAYWLDPPNRMVPSNVAGRYALRGEGREM